MFRNMASVCQALARRLLLLLGTMFQGLGLGFGVDALQLRQRRMGKSMSAPNEAEAGTSLTGMAGAEYWQPEVVLCCLGSGWKSPRLYPKVCAALTTSDCHIDALSALCLCTWT